MTVTPLRMRPSRVLRKLRAGEIVSSIKFNFADSRTVEMASFAGFDCIWTDMEHVPNDWSLVEKQILAAKCYDADVVVRTSRGGYSDYIKPLELDASGIMVPHIMSADDARKVARMTRFHPIGLRPADGGNADGAYCAIDFNDYIKQANDQRFVCVQIEDPEPMEELEEIAQVEGIDIIFFGPGDYSQAIGDPGNFSNPKIAEARKRIADVCKQYGKFAGTVGSIDNLQELVDMGYQFVNLGSDVRALWIYCQQVMAGVRRVTEVVKK